MLQLINVKCHKQTQAHTDTNANMQSMPAKYLRYLHFYYECFEIYKHKKKRKKGKTPRGIKLYNPQSKTFYS